MCVTREDYAINVLKYSHNTNDKVKSVSGASEIAKKRGFNNRKFTRVTNH